MNEKPGGTLAKPDSGQARYPITAPHFDEAEIDNLRRCLDSGWVTQGPMTAEFERKVAAVHGVTHALATTSCTAALHLATLALGLKPGDEVVVPAFTWITSANAAEYVGARAVFADAAPQSRNATARIVVRLCRIVSFRRPFSTLMALDA